MLQALLTVLMIAIGALVSFSIGARMRREALERRRDRFRASWEPLLYGRMTGDLKPLPALGRGDRLMFLTLWLQLFGYVREQAAEAMVRAAHEVLLPRYVLQLLRSRSEWKRVIGMEAAGALRLKDAGDLLTAEIAQNRPRSSVAAARALLRIDAQRGLVGLQQVLRHPGWSPIVMVEIVKTAGPEAIQMLSAMLLSALPGGARRLAQLLELAAESSALPALRERLQFSRDAEEIAAIVHTLGSLGAAGERATVVALLAHAHWLVRMQSAWALGLVGTDHDVGLLLPLLRDDQWWVRYRAAQSLLRLKGAAALDLVGGDASDAKPLEMLKRVLGEGV